VPSRAAQCFHFLIWPPLRRATAMTRSMLDTAQRFPRAGSQSFSSPAAEENADQPANVKRGNWIQTMPGKGFIPRLRLYNPLEPFFTRAWRPSEIELVR